MLRKIRLTLAILFFAAITMLFLDFTGTLHAWLGWMAKIQFLPALLALNVGVVLFLIVLTLVAGRVYCSVICPLGVFQDVVSWINGQRKKKKFRFSYSPARSWLRYGVLALFVVALIAGIGSVVALLAPYSSYGRIASNLFAPLYGWGNNLLALLAERMDSYAFYETNVWMKSLPTFLIAALTFIIISLLAWRNGRTYCNTICPVGTVLGFLSRFSLFRVSIDAAKCKECSLCSRKCKAACIDFKHHTIDHSRCVTCLDCLDTCKHDAIHYTSRLKKAPAPATPEEGKGESRRGFLSAVSLLATTSLLKAQEKKVDGGLAVIEEKKAPKRTTPIVPAGALSARNFAQHCTACQLCVSVCPNEVLRPSTDLKKLMQPEMSYERGYCRPECTKCAEVCPAGAIHPISRADKSSIQIGHAVWIKANCVPLTDGVECGNCARHCPSGAIQMVPSDRNDPESVKIPIINEERCIGCGACEALCPARPFSAIYVEGHEVHHII
ncbi:ferredoxin [Parabacteroides sp. An277]|uniref:4Fe-4S binding protein n=1 Tax=Parabacteroides sp. An277 TaxID=1965619 RepID=UPI000B3AE5F4|nr:4Fe-4S binding protein [Parabacteroides sp. An277]OUO50106.1 ferredoxin [Parabacteroides sp. An277]